MGEQILFHRRGEQPAYRVVGETITGVAEAPHTGGAFSLFEVATPAHAGAPLHQHPHAEFLYLLAGRLELVTREGRQPVAPGDFVRVPGNTPHAFHNPGDVPARALEIAAPSGVERFFADLDRSFGDQPPEPAALMEIVERHGVALA
ncbi:MAG: cupin domain-containing protein [Betaproteobacteria bacterium]|nr:cupin domain-containing protein [Betaproteobacteria bacterium]